MRFQAGFDQPESPLHAREGVHALHIPRRQTKLHSPRTAGNTAERESPESRRAFDQSEHRLDRAFAQRVPLAPASGLQAMAHGRRRRRLTWRWRRLGEAIEGRAVMGFAAERDQRLDLGSRAGVDVVLAGIPGIGQQPLDPAQIARQGLQLFEHRPHLLLVVRRLRQRGRHHQRAVGVDGGLAL